MSTFDLVFDGKSERLSYLEIDNEIDDQMNEWVGVKHAHHFSDEALELFETHSSIDLLFSKLTD